MVDTLKDHFIGVHMYIPAAFHSPFHRNVQLSPNDSGKVLKPPGYIPSDEKNTPSFQRQDALKVFERTLSMGYEKLKSSQGSVAQFAVFEPLTAEKVANNILGFIERRLQMDVAEGATQEQLQARLDAGLTGFKQGYAEASEKLKALNMLSPVVAQDIGKTYDLVLGGIDSLRQSFLTDVLKADAVLPAQFNSVGIQQQAYGSTETFQSQYAIVNRFSFQLATAEGDKITISAGASRAFAFERGPDNSSANDHANNSMNWSIQGDLSEAEMQAINSLLGQVNNLAKSFFNGDFKHAFEQALELGYDKQQITAFALNLTQAEVQRVNTAYRQFSDPQVAAVADDLHERVLPLGDFIRNLLEALDAASAFQQPQKLLSDLSERMVVSGNAQELLPGKKLREFIEQIFSGLQA